MQHLGSDTLRSLDRTQEVPRFESLRSSIAQRPNIGAVGPHRRRATGETGLQCAVHLLAVRHSSPLER